ncbi:endonuclease domain-containing protein [Corynebacterium aurimucosum]|uniref:DUF559 domain-containing protein n=1 Tax=Corynebacterium aurimucosum TaxID=169292 RepID=UPI001C0EC9D5|nr:DUF559 domain-containing protein [Corynebacterium aurimucosum]MBU5655007.1 endonuclease domain-containing protein [Corynebacterium aurimucosum]
MNNLGIFHYIDTHMVDLRTLTNDDPRWGKIHARKFHKLAWCYVIPLHRWLHLNPWERETAEVYAHARAAPRATLLGKAAARIHGIPTLTTPSEYFATVPSNSVPQRSKRQYFRYKQTKLNNQVTEVHGIRVTSLARTAIDIARFDGFVEGLVAADYVRSRRVSKDTLNWVLGNMGRVKGVADARRAVEHSVNSSESPWESYARALILDTGLPAVRSLRAQYRVNQYYADLAINGWLLIEIDGNVKYENELEEVIRAEHQRQKALLNQGFVVLRFSPQELRDAPEDFINTIARHLAAGPRNFR